MLVKNHQNTSTIPIKIRSDICVHSIVAVALITLILFAAIWMSFHAPLALGKVGWGLSGTIFGCATFLSLINLRYLIKNLKHASTSLPLVKNSNLAEETFNNEASNLTKKNHKVSNSAKASGTFVKSDKVPPFAITPRDVFLRERDVFVRDYTLETESTTVVDTLYQFKIESEFEVHRGILKNLENKPASIEKAVKDLRNLHDYFKANNLPLYPLDAIFQDVWTQHHDEKPYPPEKDKALACVLFAFSLQQ